MAKKISSKALVDKARAYADDALMALVDVATNPQSPPAARLAAANALLDRAFGKTMNIIENLHETSPREIRIVAVSTVTENAAD